MPPEILPNSLGKMKCWELISVEKMPCPLLADDDGRVRVLAYTKSEARARFKESLGLDFLPKGTKIVKTSAVPQSAFSIRTV